MKVYAEVDDESVEMDIAPCVPVSMIVSVIAPTVDVLVIELGTKPGRAVLLDVNTRLFRSTTNEKNTTAADAA